MADEANSGRVDPTVNKLDEGIVSPNHTEGAIPRACCLTSRFDNPVEKVSQFDHSHQRSNGIS
jgi:hypothetical protein